MLKQAQILQRPFSNKSDSQHILVWKVRTLIWYYGNRIKCPRMHANPRWKWWFNRTQTCFHVCLLDILFCSRNITHDAREEPRDALDLRSFSPTLHSPLMTLVYPASIPASLIHRFLFLAFRCLRHTLTSRIYRHFHAIFVNLNQLDSTADNFWVYLKRRSFLMTLNRCFEVAKSDTGLFSWDSIIIFNLGRKIQYIVQHYHIR